MPYSDYMEYMRKMNMPMQYSPMMEMPQEQLESMYPRCYFIIYPEVYRHCDMLCANYGTMCNPSRRQIEAIVDDIDNRVGADVDADYQDDDNDNDKDKDDRQFGGFGGGPFGGGNFGGRMRFRRDLIRILLLRELFRRRRPHHHGGFHGRYEEGYCEYPY